MKNNQIIIYERGLLHKVTNAIRITNKLIRIDNRKVNHFSSEDLEEMVDVVQSIFEEKLVKTGKGCSSKEAQDFVADVWNDRSQDSLVAEAYNSSKISLAKILFGSDKLVKSGSGVRNSMKQLKDLDFSDEEIKEALLESGYIDEEIKTAMEESGHHIK